MRKALVSLFALWLLALPALAMLQVTQLTGFNSEGVVPATVSNTATPAMQTNDATAYTFSTTATGTAAADRITCVAAAGANTAARTITSITVDGNAATEALQANDGIATAGIFCIANPTGTTADIVVNWSSTGSLRCAISVFALYGVASVTPTATNSSSASPGSATMNVEAGGVGLASGTSRLSATATWTGLTEYADVAGESQQAGSASLAFAGAQTPLTVTSTYSGTPANRMLVIAAFR